LTEAAQVLGQHGSALQLRYLQTLADISHDKSSLIIFPLPLDLIRPLLGALDREGPAGKPRP
jgi:hypothetical protein